MDNSDPRSVQQCLLVAFVTAVAALAIGSLVLVGWTFGIAAFKTAIPGYDTMQPNTAAGIIFAALSLGWNGAWRRAQEPSSKSLARICALLVTILGLITLSQYALKIDAGIDSLLLRETPAATGTPYPGRMSPATAAALLLLGIALWSLDAKFRRATWLSQGSALAATLIVLLSTIGYSYSANSLYRPFPYAPTAAHTALLLLLLGAGAISVRPRRGLLAVATSANLGGLAARRILPIAIAAPIFVGWLRLTGQRYGLYDTTFGAAVFATSTVTIFVIIVWLSARSLNAVDAQRRQAAASIQQSALEIQTANQRLAASEERFRLFMEHLPAAAFLKDSEGHYLWGNRTWRQQFPEEWGDLTGKTDAVLWPPEALAVFKASDQKVLEEKAPVQLLETSKIDSETRHWMVGKFPVQGPDGRLLIGGVVFDTTERKRLEVQLYQAQKLEAIGLLAGGVAHDFNNLLTVILGFADEVKLDFEEGRSPHEGLQEIQEAARKAAALTSQLLAFGRKQVMQPRVINLNQTVAEMHRILRRVLREDIHLQFSLGPEVRTVQVDPVQIQQVIINLAMNAQDAMPGGGRITIETANVELDEAYVISQRQIQPGSYVQLSVSDTGMGMDAVTQAHIFEPFFTTKLAGKGTGLGLATVYGIVKQSGGHIWLYSEPGQGTSFRIYLPRISQAGDAAAPPTVLAQGKEPTGQTILLAEDEDAVRLLILKACTKAGYQVLAATNGEAAMALAESHKGTIHLLITDVIMPGINGRVLAGHVTSLRPETKILYCSGYAESAIMQHGVLSSQATFLQKPFTAGALLQAVRAILI